MSIRAAFLDLVKRGILRATGELREGKTVYEATPDAELTPEQKAYLNRIATHEAN